MTPHALAVLREVVVVAKLFARANPPKADQPQTLPDYAKRQVGVAAVIDQFGPVSAHCTVDRPIRIDASQIVQAPAAAI